MQPHPVGWGCVERQQGHSSCASSVSHLPPISSYNTVQCHANTSEHTADGRAHHGIWRYPSSRQRYQPPTLYAPPAHPLLRPTPAPPAASLPVGRYLVVERVGAPRVGEEHDANGLPGGSRVWVTSNVCTGCVLTGA